jgi:hypothetical protein
LKFCEEVLSMYYYVSIYLFLNKDVYLWCYMSVTLGGGVTLAGGWPYK